MVWLETEKAKERSEEIRDGECEPPLEVCDEDYPLTGLRGGGCFIAGSATNDLGADPAGLAQPVDVLTADF